MTGSHLTEERQSFWYETGYKLVMKDQAHFQPVSFLHHVLDALRDLKVTIYEHSLATDAEQNISMYMSQRKMDKL